MTLARDSQVRDLYEEALRQPVAGRAAFVAARAAGDTDLLNLVERLLARHATTAVGVAIVEADGTVPAIGTVVGSYRIEALLGRGRHGRRVPRDRYERSIVPSRSSSCPTICSMRTARRRFQREAQMASRSIIRTS